jgi:predicted phosphohydrolase
MWLTALGNARNPEAAAKFENEAEKIYKRELARFKEEERAIKEREEAD